MSHASVPESFWECSPGCNPSMTQPRSLQPNTFRRRILGSEQDPVLEQRALRTQRVLGGFTRNFRMVVLLRQVRQYYVRCALIIVFGEKLGERFIRQVADSAHDPLLHRPRVGSNP